MHAGIKEVGVAIEEPFTILPLEKICDTIEGNVSRLLAWLRVLAWLAAAAACVARCTQR